MCCSYESCIDWLKFTTLAFTFDRFFYSNYFTRRSLFLSAMVPRVEWFLKLRDSSVTNDTSAPDIGLLCTSITLLVRLGRSAFLTVLETARKGCPFSFWLDCSSSFPSFD